MKFLSEHVRKAFHELHPDVQTAYQHMGLKLNRSGYSLMILEVAHWGPKESDIEISVRLDLIFSGAV